MLAFKALQSFQTSASSFHHN